MNTNDIPDFEDRAIGQAILTILFFVEVIWIFTPSISPLKLPTSANNIGNIVSHLEVFLIIVIPMAILGLVSSLFPKTRVETKASQAVNRVNEKTRAFREKHKHSVENFNRRTRARRRHETEPEQL